MQLNVQVPSGNGRPELITAAFEFHRNRSEDFPGLDDKQFVEQVLQDHVRDTVHVYEKKQAGQGIPPIDMSAP